MSVQIYGVDHGNGNIKTEHDVFPCGLVKSTREPRGFDGSDVIKFEDTYYRLSDTRLPFKNDKTEDENYFVLTLFALVREARINGDMLSGKDIVLSIGLPPADFSAHAKKFKTYFVDRSKNGVRFELNEKPISFYIKDVILSPQDYAAVIAMKADTLREFDTTYCIDIGDGTVDLLTMHGGKPDLSVMVSNRSGMAVLRAEICNRIQQDFAYQLSSRDVDTVLMKKRTILEKDIIDAIHQMAEEWVIRIVNELHAVVPDFRTAPAILLGGGSIILHDQLANSDAFKFTEFIDDIKANAIGYVAIADAKMNN